MTRLHPRKTRLSVPDRTDADASLPASPFAAFLLHRHSSSADEGRVRSAEAAARAARQPGAGR